MDIRLTRCPHPNRLVRGSGITPTDPYLEWCWLPLVGPSTVALVRRVADLTAESGEARIPLADLSRLRLGAVDAPARNNKLVRTLARAEQFGLAFTSLGVPGESVTFGIHDQVALVPARLLERLPDAARQRHVVAVETANEALTAAGLPALARPCQPPGGPLSAPRPSRRPGHSTRCQPSLSGPCTRFRRSHVSTPAPRPRPRRPRSRCRRRCDRSRLAARTPSALATNPRSTARPLTRLESRRTFAMTGTKDRDRVR